MRVVIALRNEHLAAGRTPGGLVQAPPPVRSVTMSELAAAIRRLPTLLAALVVVALLAAACGSNTPTPTPSPTATPTPTPEASPTADPTADPSADLATYRQIEAQVIAIRGLEPTVRLVPTVIDRATLVANLTAEFDRSNKPQDIAKDEALLKALGLLEAGASLRDAYLDLQGSQVVGYYSPEGKALFVVSSSGGIGALEKVTFAHEFTHALQDQHFALDSLEIDDLSNGDRAIGRLALVEGDATATQVEWMLAHLSMDELADVIAQSADPEILAAFNRAPAILRKTSLFPYDGGLRFVESLRADGDFEHVNEVFLEPPESTAQILHPELYPGSGPTVLEDLSGYAEAAGAAWTESREDTLGELISTIWLEENGVTARDAEAATAGWISDRVALFESGADHVVLFVTDWATTADADEFEDAGRTAIADQDVDEVIRVSTTRVVLVFGTDRDAVDGLSARVRTAGCC